MRTDQAHSFDVLDGGLEVPFTRRAMPVLEMAV
jgi:hypothetical protein